jgi:LysR family glycine cleavage system transcriptional activator
MQSYSRLPLGALRVFEAVARRLSFSAAAQDLSVTPAAVSQQIKSLESFIEVPLFRRSGRRVTLTEEGLELLPAVRVGLDKLQSALQQVKQHRNAGPLQVSLLSSFLQIWLLPRIRSFRRKYPDVQLRFHTSSELVDFTRSQHHAAIRFGRGNYPGLHVEKLLDDWLVPVASPALILQYGLVERGASLARFPLLEGDDEPWSVWAQSDSATESPSQPPNIDDSAGLIAAAEEGLGYVLARWTLVHRALRRGSLKRAGHWAVRYTSAYYFVCPHPILALPKVAQFREWIFAAAREFPGPESGSVA